MLYRSPESHSSCSTHNIPINETCIYLFHQIQVHMNSLQTSVWNMKFVTTQTILIPRTQTAHVLEKRTGHLSRPIQLSLSFFLLFLLVVRQHIGTPQLHSD